MCSKTNIETLLSVLVYHGSRLILIPGTSGIGFIPVKSYLLRLAALQQMFGVRTGAERGGHKTQAKLGAVDLTKLSEGEHTSSIVK